MENNILQWVGANVGSPMQFKESDKCIEGNNHSWLGTIPSSPQQSKADIGLLSF